MWGEVEMVEKQRIEISAELLEELRRGAREQGRPEGELLEEAVRRYLKKARCLLRRGPTTNLTVCA